MNPRPGILEVAEGTKSMIRWPFGPMAERPDTSEASNQWPVSELVCACM